jgi:2-polyprenyl-3-methyl-5-hydroxy-6-metoxy-1,4-benzoquinol methylase
MPQSGPAAPVAAPAEACRLCGATQAIPLFQKHDWTFVRCVICGLVSLDPLPTPAELAAHHEASYAEGRYAAFAAAEAIRDAIARDRLAMLLPLAPAGPWLDAGCSTGAFLRAAAHAGLEIEGLELSARAVAQARAGGFTVTQGTAESFTPTRRYAVVTAFDVVEHLPDPAAFGRRAAGWLLPGGVLGLTLPDIASPMARLMGRQWFYYAPPDHVHYFTPETARRLLEDAGLHEVRIGPVRKPLTIDYAAAQLAELTPVLAPVARAFAAVLPARLRRRLWPLPLGEMLVTARAAPS